MDLVEVTSSNFGDPGFVVTAFDKVDFGERYGCSPLLLGYLHLVHSPRIEPEPSRRCPLAEALNPNRMANPSV
jgi:hypothetical protein